MTGQASSARPAVAAVVVLLAAMLGGLLGLVDGARAERARPVSRAAAAPAAAATDPGFDPEQARPPSHGPVADARRAYLDRDADAARRVVAATAAAGDADREVARFVAARALERAGVEAEARTLFAELATGGGALAGPAALRRALSALAAGELAGAADAAATLRDDPSLAGQAELVELDALLALGRHADAIALARTHAGAADAPRKLSVALRLGRALAARATAETDPGAARATRLEAAGWLRAVAWRGNGAEAEQGGRELAAVVAELPEADRSAANAPTLGEREARAEALFRRYRHAEAEAAFDELAQLAGADTALGCRARLRVGQAVLNRRDRERARGLLEAVAQSCAGEPRATARFHLVRLAADRGDVAAANATAEQMHADADPSTLVDDARLVAASTALQAGDVEQARRNLDGFETLHADGDMVGDALFERGWLELRAGHPQAALDAFATLESTRPRENRDHAGGRGSYWRGRMLTVLRRSDEACDAFERTAREHPLTYYALLALSRLAELDAARHAALLAELRAAVTAAPLRFARRPEMNELPFRRAIGLARAGFPEEARRELVALGAFDDDADAELLWLGAALIDRAGNPAVAHRLVRRRLTGIDRAWPSGRTVALWRVAYPRAYAPEITQAATTESIDPALLFAIAREESAFDPGALSVAHAVGLTQLMPQTAERFARRTGLAHDRAALLDPAINARLGARYLAFLRDRLEPVPALVPSGYNAGEGSVERWLRARGSQPLDEFVEEIPYDETRRYTKRVLASWAAYRWLWSEGADATLPGLPQTLPAPRQRP